MLIFEIPLKVVLSTGERFLMCCWMCSTERFNTIWCRHSLSYWSQLVLYHYSTYFSQGPYGYGCTEDIEIICILSIDLCASTWLCWGHCKSSWKGQNLTVCKSWSKWILSVHVFSFPLKSLPCEKELLNSFLECSVNVCNEIICECQSL